MESVENISLSERMTALEEITMEKLGEINEAFREMERKVDNIGGKVKSVEDSVAILQAELLHWPTGDEKKQDEEACELIDTPGPSTSKKIKVVEERSNVHLPSTLSDLSESLKEKLVPFVSKVQKADRSRDKMPFIQLVYVNYWIHEQSKTEEVAGKSHYMLSY